jgi:hypothetical protein
MARQGKAPEKIMKENPDAHAKEERENDGQKAHVPCIQDRGGWVEHYLPRQLSEVIKIATFFPDGGRR